MAAGSWHRGAGLWGERGEVILEPARGEIFAFADLQERARREVLSDPAQRPRVIKSALER